MRGHRHSTPRARPLAPVDQSIIPPASHVYKKNGKYYYQCGTCGINGGGMPTFGRCIVTLQAHDTRLIHERLSLSSRHRSSTAMWMR